MSDASIYDSLTGAYSRALFADQLRAEVERVRRYGSLCSLLVFDLDHFKSVNDAFGHARGDEVLVEVARRVRQITRISDQFFRYGGDEFVLLLPNTPKDEAIHLAERLLETISATVFAGTVPLTLSVSIGVATFPSDAADGQALFQKADLRNYEAKRRGRACVVADDPSGEVLSLPFADGSRLIERDEALEIAQRFFAGLLIQQHGILQIVGATGMGRSRFLREVEKLAHLQGFAVITVHGRSTLKALPYGALIRGLPQLSSIPAQQLNLAVLIDALQLYLAARVADRLLLCVDDLPDLDWGTLDLIRQLLLAAPFATLGLAYTTDLANARIMVPFAVPFAAQVLLTPLSSTGLHIWLRVLMQWELPSEFIDWLEQQTHGLPAQIEQILGHLLAQGAMVKHGSGWRLVDQYRLIGMEAVLQQRRANPHNLPATLTSFIGREHELAAVRRLLPTTRLLTLTGSGGMGKTRLSLQIAMEVLDNFKDGIWFIELAALSDPALVISTLAAVLGIREQQSRPLIATVIDWLHARQLLIVLDNCEHLIEACALVAERVLQSTAQVAVLASSREPLGIAGELIYRVPPLALPDLDSQISIDQLSQYAAARLFIDRATAAKPTFHVTAINAPLIAQICHRLDGIPLAIELAAVRIQSLPIEQIALRLDDRFRLLTGGSRTALPRHQTLRSLIDWSYSLLSTPEQALLRCLAVFTGGWSLEAAEAVCQLRLSASAAPLHPADIVDLLTQLVHKSLVLLDDQASAPRYRMLETIRQYAREKLLDAQESAHLRDQHLRYYMTLAEQTEPLLISPQRAIWLPRLEAEADNLRTALEWACERDIETARWFAGTLLWFWFYDDHLSEARSWYARVLLHADQRTTVTRGLALALWGSGNVSTSLLYWDEAEIALEQSITLWRRLREPQRLAWSLMWLAYLMVFRGEGARACAIFATNESLFRTYNNGLLLVWVLMYWGRALMQVGQADPLAKARLDEALALGQVLQDPHGLAGCYLNLGHWALQQDDLVTARRCYLDALACSRQLGTGWIIADGLRTVANVMWLQGDYLQAEPLYAEAVALARANGDQLGEANSTQALGAMALHAGDLPRAKALLTSSLAAYRKWDSPLGIARCLRGYAELQRVQGNARSAAQLLGFVEAWLHTNQLNWLPFDRTVYQRGVAAAHAHLDQRIFDAAWATGQTMTLEQAIVLATSPLPLS